MLQDGRTLNQLPRRQPEPLLPMHGPRYLAGVELLYRQLGLLPAHGLGYLRGGMTSPGGSLWTHGPLCGRRDRSCVAVCLGGMSSTDISNALFLQRVYHEIL